MQPFTLAWAEGKPPVELARACLEELPPDAAGLALVYATDALADGFAEVLATLRAARPQVDWVGTVGTGLCLPGREIYDRPALALLLTGLGRAHYRLLGGDLDDFPPALLEWCGEHAGAFALVHGDPTDATTPVLVQRLAALDGVGFVNGGLTASRSVHVQAAGVVHRGGLSGVLLSPSVELLTDHTQGCLPIGPPHALTEARGNLAVRLDGRPALAVLREEVGEVMARDLARIAGYVFAALPVPRTDTGDYLVRNLVGIDPQRQLVAIGDDLEDQPQLMFCRRDGNTAREDLERMLQRVQRRLAGRPVRGGVYVSCVARGRHQFGANSEELRAVHAALGEFPLAGFFANGEIYNGRLYGYTGVLTLFVG
ncbi:MAG TPA: FIST C-terminal domain-containing protein [Gammaproteobacteria bacterium]